MQELKQKIINYSKTQTLCDMWDLVIVLERLKINVIFNSDQYDYYSEGYIVFNYKDKTHLIRTTFGCASDESSWEKESFETNVEKCFKEIETFDNLEQLCKKMQQRVIFDEEFRKIVYGE